MMQYHRLRQIPRKLIYSYIRRIVNNDRYNVLQRSLRSWFFGQESELVTLSLPDDLIVSCDMLPMSIDIAYLSAKTQSCLTLNRPRLSSHSMVCKLMDIIIVTRQFLHLLSVRQLKYSKVHVPFENITIIFKNLCSYSSNIFIHEIVISHPRTFWYRSFSFF